MANWATLKTAIANVIKTNGNQEITGALLQNTLNNMVNSLGENYTFVGIATPITNPGAPDGNVFYLAGEGTYPNFSSITIDQGQLGILKWNGSWEKIFLEISNSVNIAQTTGQSTTAVMSQKATTDELNQKASKDELNQKASKDELEKVKTSVSRLESNFTYLESTTDIALGGASARFDGIEESPNVTIEDTGSSLDGGTIIFSTVKKVFLYYVEGKYYNYWKIEGKADRELFEKIEGKTFICGTDIYVWDATKNNIVRSTTDLTEVNKSLSQHTSRLDELDAAVFPYSLSVSGGGVFEKGTSQSVTITWSMKKGGSPIVPDSVKINGALVTGTNKVYTGVTTNTTYNVAATKGSVTKTASTSVRFVNPSYLGIVSESFVPSESAIKALAKGISESKGRILSGANLTNQKICYAYPKTFGVLTSIKDANNFEYINSYNRTELAINGETYYVYVLKDATSISGFKQVYS